LTCFFAETDHVVIDKLVNFNLGTLSSMLEGKNVVVLVLVAQYTIYAKWCLTEIAESLDLTFFVFITVPRKGVGHF
jgi:hypothetical protein